MVIFTDDENFPEYPEYPEYSEYPEYDTVCTTVRGPRPNKPCKFPFIFNGEIKNTCIKGQLRPEPWCSTKVDVLEHYIRGEWGYCGESCSNSGNTTNCDWGPGPGFEKPGFGFLCIFAHFRPQKGNPGTRVLRLKNETCSNGKNPGFKPGSGTRAQSLTTMANIIYTILGIMPPIFRFKK